METRPDAPFNPLATLDPSSPGFDGEVSHIAEAVLSADAIQALRQIAAIATAEAERIASGAPKVRSEIYTLMAGCIIEPSEQPPTMEALDRIAGLSLGALLRQMEAAPEPYMEANADIIREAWCSLEVVNLTGPPHNA